MGVAHARVAWPTVLVLVLDTATPAVTAAVVRVDGAGGRLLAARVTVDARAHAEVLTPNLLACLDEAGVAVREVDAVVCGTGPGPYTGLRVGMATAAALGDALGVPVHGVCSLDGIGGATARAGELLVVTDARRREVYAARYTDGLRTRGPWVQRPAELDLTGVTAVAGALALATPLGLPVLGPEHPDPLALVAAVDLGSAPSPFTPLYLRRPDAVEPARVQVPG